MGSALDLGNMLSWSEHQSSPSKIASYVIEDIDRSKEFLVPSNVHNFTIPNSEISFSTSYKIYAIDELGNYLSSSNTITILNSDRHPNSFSPNRDNINESYGIVGDYIDYHLTIIDRWGKVVFESYNQDNKWDGKYNSKDLRQGEYLYIFEGITTDSLTINLKNILYLIR